MFEPRLGVSLHTVGPALTASLVEAVAGSRVATLELYPPLLDSDADGTGTAELRRRLDAEAFRAATVHARFGGQYDISVQDPERRRAAVASALEAIQLAGVFGAPMVVLHASAEPIAPADRALRFRCARESLATLTAAAAAQAVRVAVELLPRSCLGNTVAELGQFLAGLPECATGVCLDVNHLMDRHGELAASVRSLGPRLVTLHLSDYDGIDEKHWLPGQGVLDWRGFMQALRDIDYQGPFNYEAKLEGETPADRLAALERNFDWLCGF